MNKLKVLLQVLLLVLTLGFWLVWPPVRDAARWKQSVARPAPPRSATRAVPKWEPIAEYGLLWAGAGHHLPQLVGEGNPGLTQAVAHFAPKYQALHRQLKDPEFAVTHWDLLALSAYSQVLTAMNQPESARAVGLDCLRAADQIGHRQNDFLGQPAQVQAEALTTIELLLARVDWSPGDLQELSRLLKADELSQDCLIQSLQNQMRQVEAGWTGDKPALYLSIPGGTARHKRIYQCQSLKILGLLESGIHLQETPGMEEHSFWGDLKSDPCLSQAASAQRKLAFTRLRHRLDLQWVEALREGKTPSVAEPIEEWLRPEVENTLACCWMVKDDRLSLAPWCLRFPPK